MNDTLIDTSVLLAPAADRAILPPGWVVSTITVGEMEAGVLKARDPSVAASRLRQLTGVLGEADALIVDRAVAARYGELRAKTGRSASNDLWIAATALAHDLVLVTRDSGQAKLPLIRAELIS